MSGIVKGGISLVALLRSSLARNSPLLATLLGSTPGTPTLLPLSLSNNTLNENSPAGTVVGSIQNLTAGSTLSLAAGGDAGGRFAISGTALVAGATSTDYETATSHSVTIVETLAGATGTPKSTTLTIGVVNLNDTNPSAFTFTDVSGATLSSPQTSNAITVAGLSASDSATAAISGDASSQMRVNGGSWIAGPVSVVNGDTIAVRHTSSGTNLTAINTTLTVGTTADTFTSTTAASSSVAYDTSIGLGVDANGFTTLTPDAGATVFYVKNGGSDANAGTNPSAPLATVVHAISLVTAGKGDQVLLAEGSTFNETLPWLAFKGGKDAAHPTVISSYDPTDPTNWTKTGMGHQRGARPKITGEQGQVNGNNFFYLAIKGIEFNPGSAEHANLSFVGNNSGTGGYFLFENNIFAYLGISYDGGAVSLPFATQHIVIRNNSFYGMYAITGGRTGGIYMGGGVDHFTAEDNVFWHTGWPIGGARTDVALNGTQSHAMYIQTDTSNVIVRRNLSVDPSSDGGILRGSGVWTENVTIHAPAGTGLGPDGSHWSDLATGVDVEASYNLTIAGISNGDGAGPPGYGYTTGKGNPGSRVHHNVIVRSENLAGNASAFSNVSAGTNQSYMEFENNLEYLWTGSGHTYFVDVGTYSSYTIPYTSYDRNAWDDPASGTNVASSGLSFPNAYTPAQLYVAAGYADLAALVADAVAHPELHVQRTLRSLAFAGYGRAASPSDVVSPTLSAPSGSSSSAGTATLGVTTDDATGTLYYVLTGSSAPPHVSQIKMGVTAAHAAASKAGSVAITSSGAKTVNVSSVPPGTYYAHMVHEDAEANKSLAVSTSSFTVASASGTWDGANSSADWTLSGGNLTATRSSTGAGFWAMLRGTTAKTSGTIIVTVVAAGSGVGPVYIGFDTGAETQFPGQDGTGASIGYAASGSIQLGGGNVATVASYTTGDVIKIVRTGSSFAFYKNNVLQTTIDTGPLGEAIASVAAYPAASNGNGTGTQLTADFSGW